MMIQRSCLQFLFQFVLLVPSLCQPVDIIQIPNNTMPTSNDKLMQRSKVNLICNINQYYDNEEGRCSGVPGGGRAIHIDRIRLCLEPNILSAHCKHPRYYYICKNDKIILAECGDGTHFDSRFQRCVFVDPASFDSSIILAEDMLYQRRIELPECQKAGRFPVANNCALFYVCGTNGHRLHQKAFKCPNGTGFNAEKKVCSPVPNCKDESSESGALCLVNTNDEHIQLDLAPERHEDEVLHSVNDSSSTTTVSSREYLIETTTPSPEYNYQKFTTLPISINDSAGVISIQATTESSILTTESYERSGTSMVQDQTSTIEPIIESHQYGPITKESNSLGTSTQASLAPVIEELITSSTLMELSRTTENANQADVSVTTSAPYDKLSFVSSSTISPTDEFTFGTELLKEESFTTPFTSHTGFTSSPLIE